MAIIQLTQGLTCELDDADMSLVQPYKWCAHKGRYTFYAATTINKKTVHMHRLLAGKPGMVVDHLDGNGLNNRRANLRPCSRRENSIHSRKRKTADSTSVYRGVYALCGRWSSRIVCHGKTYFLGLYHSEKAAAIAYNRAARRLFGEFAKLNEFPK